MLQPAEMSLQPGLLTKPGAAAGVCKAVCAQETVLGAAGSGGAAKEAARNVLSKCKLGEQARDLPK